MGDEDLMVAEDDGCYDVDGRHIVSPQHNFYSFTVHSPLIIAAVHQPLFLVYTTIITRFRFLLKVIADADILIVAFAKFGIELF